MRKRRSDSSSSLLDRLAIEDFGTADVPLDLRRRARLDARKLGISPRQALDKIRARAAARKERREKRRSAGASTGASAQGSSGHMSRREILSALPGGTDPGATPHSGAHRKVSKKAMPQAFHLTSKSGVELRSGGRCLTCGKDYSVVWRYRALGVGLVDLCVRCKAEALDRSFGKIDALDRPHHGSQFESNRRRH